MVNPNAEKALNTEMLHLTLESCHSLIRTYAREAVIQNCIKDKKLTLIEDASRNSAINFTEAVEQESFTEEHETQEPDSISSSGFIFSELQNLDERIVEKKYKKTSLFNQASFERHIKDQIKVYRTKLQQHFNSPLAISEENTDSVFEQLKHSFSDELNVYLASVSTDVMKNNLNLAQERKYPKLKKARRTLSADKKPTINQITYPDNQIGLLEIRQNRSSQDGGNLFHWPVISDDLTNEDIATLLVVSLLKTKRLIEKNSLAQQAGACVIVSLVHKDQVITVNIGDSRALLLAKTNDDTYSAKYLSQDHAPNTIAEEIRIIQEDASVEDRFGVKRVGGNLAVARTIGDTDTQGATGIPECTISDCQSTDRLILHSDGIPITCDEIETIANEHLAQNPSKFMSKVFQYAAERINDDKTLACVPCVNHACVIVVDGHGSSAELLRNQILNEFEKNISETLLLFQEKTIEVKKKNVKAVSNPVPRVQQSQTKNVTPVSQSAPPAQVIKHEEHQPKPNPEIEKRKAIYRIHLNKLNMYWARRSLNHRQYKGPWFIASFLQNKSQSRSEKNNAYIKLKDSLNQAIQSDDGKISIDHLLDKERYPSLYNGELGRLFQSLNTEITKDMRKTYTFNFRR